MTPNTVLYKSLIISVFYVVQLGGLEPPTSCSTDRRSNQLSYNCIRFRPRKKGGRTGRKLGATARFGKAAGGLPSRHPLPRKDGKKTGGPGFARASCEENDRSGGRLEQFRRVGLDRLDRFGGDLLAQFGELL